MVVTSPFVLPDVPRENVKAETIAQIGRIGQLDPEVVERVRHEVSVAVVPWVEEYGRYQSGGWWTASLLNGSGAGDDVEIADCDPQPTNLLVGMPVTQRFLASLDLNFMWVRIARLSANSFLWEHRDYAELDGRDRVRIHVPLVTNPTSALILGGLRVHLGVGHAWRLRPTQAHGACNLMGPDRVHIVIDAYSDSRTMAWDQAATLSEADIERLPAPSAATLRACHDMAHNLAHLGFVETAERHLLRLYYNYSLPEGSTYEMIAALHRERSDEERAAQWDVARETLLARRQGVSAP